MKESPLSEVVRNRKINGILEEIRSSVRHRYPIVIEPKDVDYIRRSFIKGLHEGEQKLYQSASEILAHFEPNKKIEIVLITWGRCATHSQELPFVRETQLEAIQKQLHETSDMLLASQFPPICPECKMKCMTVASFVQQRPQNSNAILSLQTRIKTTSNICYKIADMVFDIDFMFQRDKIVNEFSQIVTDIYGIKIVAKGISELNAITRFLHELPGAQVVGEKNYIGKHRKKSGYEAFKVILRKDLQIFEVQIQTEAMSEFERTNSIASHHTYKEIQMMQRRKLGREYIELFKALSQLFAKPDENCCSIEYIEIGRATKGADDVF